MHDIEKIKAHCQSKNYNSRKFQYQIISDLTGVTPEQAKQVCSMQRQIRFALPKDEIGEAKEKDWHAPHYIKAFECQANNKFRITLLNNK